MAENESKASKADTAETKAQLDLQMQINQVLQDRMKVFKAQEKALSGQVQMAVDLCKALKCDELDKIEERLKTARDAMQEAADQAAELGDSLEDAADKGSEGAGRTQTMFEKLKEKLTAVNGAAVGAGLGLAQGFGSAIQTATNLTTGIFGIVGSLGKLGISIATLPFKLLSGLFSLAGSGGGGGPSPIQQELEKIRGEFGSLAVGAGKVAKSALSQFRGEMKNLAGTGLTLRKVFGGGREGLAKALAENAELLKALGPAAENFNDVLSTGAVALSMYRKGLGMTVEQQAKFLKLAQAAGKDPMKEMTKFASQAINMGEAFGMSSKLIAKDMAEMQSDFAHFGGLGPKVMSQISVYTRKLGIEIKDLTGLIDGFDDFENAAQGAAKLSQAFGMNVDAMKMMQEQDPAARLSMLQQAFKQTGKSIEQMSRQEKKLLAQQSGLSEEAAALAFSQRGLSMSYDQVQKAGAKSEKKQLSQAEAMSKLADSIERVFGSGGGGGFKSFFEAFSKGFQSGIMRTVEFRQAMKAIRGAMRAVYMGGREVGKMFVQMFPGIKQMLGGIKDLFNPARFKQMMASVKNIFKDFFKDLQTDPKAGVEKFLDRFKDLFKKFFSASGPGASSIMEGGKTFLKTLGAIFKAVFPIVVSGLVTAINKITEILKNPPGVPGALTQLFKDLGNAMMDLLSTLWTRLAPALGDMFKTLFEKVGPYLAMGGTAILAVSFGKVILNAVVKGLAGGLVAVVAKKIADFFGAAFGQANQGAGDVGRGVGEGFAASLKGFFQGLGDVLKEIGKITAPDIGKAALSLFLLTAMLIPPLVLLAGGIAIIAMLFSPASAITAALAMVALAVAAVAIKVLMEAINLVQPSMIGQALMGAAAAALFVVSGVLILAFSLRLISGVFRGVNWENVAMGMLGMVVSIIAIGVMVLAAAALVADGGMTAMLAIAGLGAATLFLFALSIFMIPLMLVSNLLSAINMDPMPFISMAAIMVAIAVMAGASVILALVAQPALTGLIVSGGFMLALVYLIMPIMKELSNQANEMDFGKLALGILKMSLVFVGLAIIAVAAVAAGAFAVPAMIGLLLVLAFASLLASDSVGLKGVLDKLKDAASTLNDKGIIDTMKNLVGIIQEIASLAFIVAEAGSAAFMAYATMGSLKDYLEEASTALLPAMSSFIRELVPTLQQLSSITGNVEELSQKVELIGNIMGMITDLGEIAVSLGEMDVGMFTTGDGSTLRAATDFADKMFSGTKGLIDKIIETGAGMTADQIASAVALGSVLGSIGGLVKSLQPDPEMMKALKDTESWVGDETPERMAALSDHMERMLNVLKDNIGKVFTAVKTAAEGITDPAALEPKIKIVATSFQVLGNFSKVIGEMIKNVAGEEGTSEEQMKKFSNTVTGIVDALFSTNSPSAFKKAFDGINEIASLVSDPAALEPKIKVVASMFEVLGKFAAVIGDMSKLIPEAALAGAGELVGAGSFAKRLATLTGPEGMINSFVNALSGDSGALKKTFDSLNTLVEMIPSTKKGALKEFQTKVSALVGLFDIVGKFSSAVKEIVGLTANAEGKVDASKLQGVLTTVNGALFSIEGQGGAGTMKWIAQGIAKVITEVGTGLVGKEKEIKALSNTFKAIGDFASAISAIRGLAGESGDMNAVATTLNGIADVFKQGTLIQSITTIVGKMVELQALLARNPLSTRNVTKLTDFANGLDTAISAMERISNPSTDITTRVESLSTAFTTLSTAFSQLENDPNLRLAVRVGENLTGNGTVTVTHEPVNITLNVNIEMSAEQIGRGVIRWNNTVARGTPANPKFVVHNGTSNVPGP
jgi:hypothetical protein